jgi:hypothetical protein
MCGLSISVLQFQKSYTVSKYTYNPSNTAHLSIGAQKERSRNRRKYIYKEELQEVSGLLAQLVA